MIMKYISFFSFIVILFFTSCHSEYRIYKRVGGKHLNLKSGEKELFWFSGMHGSNPDNPMFIDLKDEFQNFQPDFVLVEGNANNRIPNDSLSAIKKGESVYVSFLANRSMTPCQSTEPTDSSMNKFLIAKYKKEDILAMYIIRQMVQWSRVKKLQPDFNERVIRFANSINNDIRYTDKDLSLAQISLLLETHTNIVELNNETWHNFDAKNYIYFSTNVISEIYNKTSEYRNIYLVDLIKEKTKSYDRIFIMMGFDHAIEIDKELQEIFEYP